MRIVLVKPSNLGDHIQPSLGLGYLATSVRELHKVFILDCFKQKVKIKDIPKEILKFNPQVVGIQCLTFDIFNVRSILNSIKLADKAIITVVGGPHISALPYQTLGFFGDVCDFGFIGEAETGFPKLIQAIEDRNFENIEGLIRRENGKIIINDKVLIDDLDSLGQPSWDILKPEEYPPSQHGAFFSQFPIAPIITTRGCPYNCTFCSVPELCGKKLRHHSAEYVCDEIKYLYQKRGIREFHIIDDGFTTDINYAKHVCSEIASLNLNLSFATPNGIRMEAVDDELLLLMKKCGFYSLSVAPESGSEQTLARIRKGFDKEKINEICAKIKKFGFDLAGFFVIGFPWETEKEIEKTISFSTSLGLMRANFFCFLPLPGSQLYRELLATGEIEDIDWRNFYFMNAPYVSAAVTRPLLLSLKRKAFLNFYLRPDIFWNNLIRIKTLRHLWFLLKRAYRWLMKW
ncbi:MAG: radical SAM protein [bacterium]